MFVCLCVFVRVHLLYSCMLTNLYTHLYLFTDEKNVSYNKYLHFHVGIYPNPSPLAAYDTCIIFKQWKIRLSFLR